MSARSRAVLGLGLIGTIACSEPSEPSGPTHVGELSIECLDELLPAIMEGDLPERLEVEIHNLTDEPRWLASSHMCGEQYARLEQASLPGNFTVDRSDPVSCIELTVTSEDEWTCERPRLAGLSPGSWLTENRRPTVWESYAMPSACETDVGHATCGMLQQLPAGEYALSVVVGTQCQLVGGGPCEVCYTDLGETCKLEAEAVLTDARERVVPVDLPASGPVIVEITE